ncbi:MAG: C25 family cysteine peptidase [Bacteroidaceae bacterium]|nr:C25 family cysteine peptidase [Bacteroidaceae bacterium]
MKKTLTLFLLALAAIVSHAQDLTFTLGDLPTTTQNKVDATYGGINFCYLKNSKILGAYIYRNDTRYGDHSLTITSEKNITKIEFEGEVSQSDGKRTADVTETTGSGTFTFNAYETSVWTGSSKQVRFAGMSETTSYVITTIRLWIEGGGEGGTIDILQRPGKDVHYYAQGHTLPYDGRPSTLAVVAHSQFRSVLQDYLVWKTQQGYHVEEFYADEISKATGKTLDDLALEIRSRLMALDPQPSYVLLAGDEDEVPYFEPRTTMAGGQDAVTDFFYGEYTGDHFPEAAVGRFSAVNVEQLQAQMDKTKYMAFIDPAKSDWLKRSFIAHAPASDISTEKSKNLGIEFAQKFEGNTSSAAYPSNTGTEINKGCSFVAYLGHGSWNGWQGYHTSNLESLNNKDMYPVVLGLTCLSGSFQFYECFAEAMVRKPNAGAVAYIGATRESWDGSDNLFFMGGNSSYNSFEHIGFMRSLFQPDAEDESQVTRTIGDAFNIGKFADRFLGEHQPFRQFMEFFTLFGDPTYQPYITVPKQMTISAAASVAAGRCVEVLTAPDAVVCISQGRKVVAVGVADHDGKLSLKVPADAPTGACTIYSSAPFYNDYYTNINVTTYDGGEDETESTKKLPKVEYADVINVTTAASALPINRSTYLGYQPEPFGVESPARYTMWAATNTVKGSTEGQFSNWETYPNDESRAIYLRNKYEQNSFITTESAGNVAYVSVEWLHPCGQAEILGVYGSDQPYTSTLQAWNGGAGTKLGEIRKGTNDYLKIEGEWPYILVRAEDYEGYFSRSSADQNDVFIKSLTIGWNEQEGLTTGIELNEPQVEKEMTLTFDLTGRRAYNSARGILLQGGKKILK